MIPNVLSGASCAAFWINHFTSHTWEHLGQMYPLTTKILNWKQAATAVLPPQKELLPQPFHYNNCTTSTSSPQLNSGAQCDVDQSALPIGTEFPGVLANHFSLFSWDLVNHLLYHFMCVTHFRLLSVQSQPCGLFVKRALPHWLHELQHYMSQELHACLPGASHKQYKHNKEIAFMWVNWARPLLGLF